MWLVQRTLLILGAAALGIVLSVVSTALLIAALLPPRPGTEPGLNWGPAFVLLPCGLCGGVSGAVAGFVSALRWIAQSGDRPWPPTTWIGIALGLAAACAIRLSGLLHGHLSGDLIRWWPGMAIFFAASGCMGGILGGLIGVKKHS